MPRKNSNTSIITNHIIEGQYINVPSTKMGNVEDLMVFLEFFLNRDKTFILKNETKTIVIVKNMTLMALITKMYSQVISGLSDSLVITPTNNAKNSAINVSIKYSNVLDQS